MYQANKGISLMNQILPEYGSGADALRKYHQSRGHSLGNPADPGFAGKLMAERARIDRQAPAPAAPAERSAQVKKNWKKNVKNFLMLLSKGVLIECLRCMPIWVGALHLHNTVNFPQENNFSSNTRNSSTSFSCICWFIRYSCCSASCRSRRRTSAPQPSLEEQVRVQAEEIRTAAKGGLIRKYDLGGLVDNMLLQASRTQKNIPSNAVS